MRGAAIYHLSHDIFVHSDWTNGSATPCMAKIITSLSFSAIMANPRKFSEKIALHNQKQAEETAAFEAIMKEVNSATRTVSVVLRRFTPLSIEEASPSVQFSQGRLLLILSLFAPVVHSRSCIPNTCQSPQALVPVTEEDHYRTSTRSVLIRASTYRWANAARDIALILAIVSHALKTWRRVEPHWQWHPNTWRKWIQPSTTNTGNDYGLSICTV